MPILAYKEPLTSLPQYFESLTELDEWYTTPRRRSNALKQGSEGYYSRSDTSDPPKGKLLVCHDYKGGYTESPSSLSYTFNFWELCDTFIYFSHHRITIPPPGWISAAHRQGVKMLGTLIFEDSGQEDCLRLLLGHLPKSKTGTVQASNSQIYLQLSPHYARALACLAAERGFDGYLLNFECPLQGRTEQVRLLDAWITLLDAELRRTVGAHAQTIWYDSVIVTGDLRWQDRLNSLNLPFFLSSTSFFTNYTWPPHFPGLCAQYLFTLDQELTKSRHKNLNDIWIGVDVWGRGSHGNGGFGSYRAITHADPEFLGLSVALFGPAWTWESEQDKDGWDWEQWWAYERKLWVGPEDPSEKVEVPDMPTNQPPCPHGDFQPISSFFPCLSPPNPAVLNFHTTFSPGIGYAWFVEGRQVMHKSSGWTDLDKQTSLGNLVWPRPIVSWEGDALEHPLPVCKPSLSHDDAWNGGSSLRLTLTSPGSQSEDGFFQCVWVPIQSLSLTPQLSYDVALIYKVTGATEADIGLSCRFLTNDADVGKLEITAGAEGTSAALANGWNKTSIQIVCSEAASSDITCAIGVVVGIAPANPSEPFEVLVQLGQLNVTPSLPLNVEKLRPQILWANLEPFDSPPAKSGVVSDASSSSILSLTWDASVSMGSAPMLRLISAEDPNPSWNLHRSESWFPAFAYFNIYGQAYDTHPPVWNPDEAIFIGTTGLDCCRDQFNMEKESLPEKLRKGVVRFYVQGVLNTGEVLPWDACAFVEVTLD